MKIIRHDGTLEVSEVDELAAATSAVFAAQLQPLLAAQVRQIDIDLSGTTYADCGGLGALIAMRKCARSLNEEVRVRLLNPTLPVRRLFNLTHLNQSFSIERH